MALSADPILCGFERIKFRPIKLRYFGAIRVRSSSRKSKQRIARAIKSSQLDLTMTIQVQREVLISLNKHTKWPIAVEDDVVSVESDCLTLSTASLSDDAESLDCRVSFSEELVTDVWERPPTQIEEIPDLFYSKEETDR